MTEDEPTTSESIADQDRRELLLRGGLVVFALIALLALIQLYSSIGAVINEWVARQYRPLFRAGLNLVILLGAGIGISLVIRELSADE